MTEDSPITHLAGLATGLLDPLFWQPTRLGGDSAWLGHVPFGHWLVSTHRPASIVEIGTRSGVSFAAFCEAALRGRIGTRAVAVQTRCGVDGADPDDDPDADLGRFLDQHYAAVSTLLRAASGDALAATPDGSVDLLHLNHVRPPEDIAEMFHRWMPKLSTRAVVLIHAVGVGDGASGGRRLWTDVAAKHPHFEFFHGRGLGMLAMGDAVDGAIRELCASGSGDAAAVLRRRFSILGNHWVLWRDSGRERRASTRLRMEVDRLGADSIDWRRRSEAAREEADNLSSRLEAVGHSHDMLQAEHARLRADLALRDDQVASLTTENDAQATRSAALGVEIARMQSCVDAAHAELDAFSQELIALRHERDTLLRSTSWRVTAPLRRLRDGKSSDKP